MDEKSIVKRLNWYYYGSMVLAMSAAVACYKFIPLYQIWVDPLSTAGIVITYCVIAYMLLSVAGGLWWFNRQNKKLRKREDPGRLRAYLSNARLRLILIGLGLVFGVVAYYIVRVPSMIWCAGISAIGLYFCKPTVRKIELDLLDTEE